MSKTLIKQDGRICTKCLTFKKWENFFIDSGQKTGRRPHCKICDQKKSLEWARNNKDKRVHYMRKSLYDITKEQYYALLESQNNLCAICGIREQDSGKSFVMDHCHINNKNRGILCNNCNVALGFFSDKIENLKNAIKYLEYYDSKNSCNI